VVIYILLWQYRIKIISKRYSQNSSPIPWSLGNLCEHFEKIMAFRSISLSNSRFFPRVYLKHKRITCTFNLY
jgi:hypothetical protein